METIDLFIFGFSSYLIGSIPFAYLLPKLFGFGDIRKIGSGNVGSTNVLRTGNKFLAIIVLLFDILKGFLPFFCLKIFLWNAETNLTTYLVSSLVIIGHLFPIWLKFKGGKGVATYIGFLFSINYLLGLIFICSWLIIALITKYSSLSSILSILIIPPVVIFLFSFNFSINSLFIIISVVIISKHYSNILRLFNKTESKIKF